MKPLKHRDSRCYLECGDLSPLFPLGDLSPGKGAFSARFSDMGEKKEKGKKAPPTPNRASYPSLRHGELITDSLITFSP